VRVIECGDDGGVSLAGRLGAVDVEREPEAEVTAGG
jgi:hypothetical protein